MKNLAALTIAVTAAAALAGAGCNSSRNPAFTGAPGEVHLIILDPGHFHAALVQKVSYTQVDPDVYVYAPQGDDVTQHLALISSYNNRPSEPTHWNEVVYTGDDFLQRMLDQHRGNVVVMAGRNGVKTDYIYRSVEAGMNVLADKPMAIDRASFYKLLGAFDMARRKGLLLYDIMTERYETTNALLCALARMPELIGEIEKGTPNNPAIVRESIHHFAKMVSGKPLIRPEWYFDTRQQGEGIVDVTTHLVDLVQLTVAGEEPIDYMRDIHVNAASHWPTPISRTQYRLVTGKSDYAPFLAPFIANDTLRVMANGQIDYSLRGVNVRVVARWDFMVPQGASVGSGAGDTDYALVRGERGSVVIRQGEEQGYRPTLFAEVAAGRDTAAFENALRQCVSRLAAGDWPGLAVDSVAPGKWQVVVPPKYDVGHEAHFGQVMQHFLGFLAAGRLPEWEIAGMKAKYYTTTTALQMAKE